MSRTTIEYSRTFCVKHMYVYSQMNAGSVPLYKGLMLELPSTHTATCSNTLQQTKINGACVPLQKGLESVGVFNTRCNTLQHNRINAGSVPLHKGLGQRMPSTHAATLAATHTATHASTHAATHAATHYNARGSMQGVCPSTRAWCRGLPSTRSALGASSSSFTYLRV